MSARRPHTLDRGFYAVCSTKIVIISESATQSEKILHVGRGLESNMTGQ